jgi:hypothetical protein
VRKRAEDVKRIRDRIRDASTKVEIVDALNDVVNRLLLDRQGKLSAERKIDASVRVLDTRQPECTERRCHEVADFQIGHAPVVRDVLHFFDKSVRDAARDEQTGYAAARSTAILSVNP